MGNVPMKPSTERLPRPEVDSELDKMLIKEGFKWGKKPEGELCTNVEIPSGWLLHDPSTSS
jgi:hypothetical protein